MKGYDYGETPHSRGRKAAYVALGRDARDNGRFLRHRPKRSGRCLNYEKLYQGHGRCQRAKVCRRPSVKTMLYAVDSGRFPSVTNTGEFKLSLRFGVTE